MTGNVMWAPGRVVSCVIKEVSMQGSVNQSKTSMCHPMRQETLGGF